MNLIYIHYEEACYPKVTFDNAHLKDKVVAFFDQYDHNPPTQGLINERVVESMGTYDILLHIPMFQFIKMVESYFHRVFEIRTNVKLLGLESLAIPGARDILDKSWHYKFVGIALMRPLKN